MGSPRRADGSTLYNDQYAKNVPTWHVEDSAWKAEQILRMIEKNSLQPIEVCELGCGAGEILRVLSTKLLDANFTGYEISKQAYNLCLKRESERVRFYLDDMFAVDQHKEFDLLLIIDVLEHVEDCFQFLRRAKTKAKYKLLHIPLDLSLQSLLRMTPILNSREKVGHVHYFTKETALATLQDCDYDVVDYCYTYKAFELPGSFRRRVVNLPRRLIMTVNEDIAVRLLGGCSLLVLAT